MKYNRHENRVYSYRIDRIRSCRIVHMSNRNHLIKYLSDLSSEFLNDFHSFSSIILAILNERIVLPIEILLHYLRVEANKIHETKRDIFQTFWYSR